MDLLLKWLNRYAILYDKYENLIRINLNHNSSTDNNSTINDSSKH